jgi:hypothetical protein
MNLWLFFFFSLSLFKFYGVFIGHDHPILYPYAFAFFLLIDCGQRCYGKEGFGYIVLFSYMAPQELRETKWAAILLLKDDQKTRGVIVIHMYILTLLLLSCYRSEKEGGAF